MTTPFTRCRGVTALFVVALFVSVSMSPAEENGPAPWTLHPGYVSGSAFSALADEDGELVEVSVTGALLRLVSASVRAQDADLAAMIDALAAVSAVVVEVDSESTERLDRAERDLSARLDAGGWNAVARIRDGASRVTVWVLPRDGSFEGLTVLVRDGRDVVFTNIAGTIDMEQLQGLTSRLNLPGLEQFIPRDLDPGNDTGRDGKKRQ